MEPAGRALTDSRLSEAHRDFVARATPGGWFRRGVLVGVMLFSAGNAASYFVLSDAGGNLLGTHPERAERLGFPWTMAERVHSAQPMQTDHRLLTADLLCVLGLGCVLGVLAASRHQWLNARLAPIDAEIAANRGESHGLQFSLRGLLLAMTAGAILASVLGRVATRRPEALGLIYLLGPWALVSLAMVPRRIPWEHRVGLLCPLAVMLIGGAILVGGSLQPRREFEEVLLGIFVCWTPQSVVAAAAITLFLVVRGAGQAPAGQSA